VAIRSDSIILLVRRLLTVFTCATGLLLLPGLAAAEKEAPRDGTLSIVDGKGYIRLDIRGGVIGRFAKGSVTITDPQPFDERAPLVWGSEDETVLNLKQTVYAGENVRFRLTGGKYTIQIRATGVDLSAVGKGFVRLQAKTGVENAGTFAINGEEPRPLPERLKTFTLEAPVATPE
jgi:hypothetical protein